jgi:F-type H+-transporting ATPase subunit a
MKALLWAIGILALVLVGMVFFRLPQPVVEIAPEPIFSIGGWGVNNTIFTAWVMIILIVGGLSLGLRNLKMVPSGFQNLFEFIWESFEKLAYGVAGEKNGRKFFPLVFIFLIYIMACNWAALTPLFNHIGVMYNKYEQVAADAQKNGDKVAEHEKEVQGWIMSKGTFTIVPLFQNITYYKTELPAGETYNQRLQRLNVQLAAAMGKPGDPNVSPLAPDQTYGFPAPFLRGVNTDVNAPLAYAIWSAIFVEFWGVSALGLAYFTKFFNFRSFAKGKIMNGVIEAFVGILELISELSRLVSFTFRLFGNIFAGEILLFMMAFLVPFVMINVFYFLELFVGLIQAFVFAMLTLVFAVMAVTAHHDDHEHEHGHAPEGAGHAAGHGAPAHGHTAAAD